MPGYLQPHKLKPLNQDLIIISRYIVSYLERYGNKVRLQNIIDYLKKTLEVKSERKIILSLNFLFILGKVSYDEKNDAVEKIA